MCERIESTLIKSMFESLEFQKNALFSKFNLIKKLHTQVHMTH